MNWYMKCCDVKYIDLNLYTKHRTHTHHSPADESRITWINNRRKVLGVEKVGFQLLPFATPKELIAHQRVLIKQRAEESPFYFQPRCWKCKFTFANHNRLSNHIVGSSHCLFMEKNGYTTNNRNVFYE